MSTKMKPSAAAAAAAAAVAAAAAAAASVAHDSAQNLKRKTSSSAVEAAAAAAVAALDGASAPAAKRGRKTETEPATAAPAAAGGGHTSVLDAAWSALSSLVGVSSADAAASAATPGAVPLSSAKVKKPSGRTGKRESSNKSCPHCSVSISGTTALRVHLAEVHNDKAFECEHPGCTYASAYKANVKKHTKQKHTYVVNVDAFCFFVGLHSFILHIKRNIIRFSFSVCT